MPTCYIQWPCTFFELQAYFNADSGVECVYFQKFKEEFQWILQYLPGILQNSELNYWLTFKNLNEIDHSTQEVQLGFELVWQEVEFTDSSLLILRNGFKP